MNYLYAQTWCFLSSLNLCMCVIGQNISFRYRWWRHQMEAFPALLAICAGNLPVPGEFPAQRPVTRSFDVFFYLRLNKWLSKQWWGWRFETPSHPLWRHCSDMIYSLFHYFILMNWCAVYRTCLFTETQWNTLGSTNYASISVDNGLWSVTKLVESGFHSRLEWTNETVW